MSCNGAHPWIVVLHPCKLLLFAFLTAADLLMTWHLIDLPSGRVYEWNPVASAWLGSFGWVGLVAFKSLAMVDVMLACIVLSLRRPRLGGGILNAACAATGMVVLYSCCLCFHDGPNGVYRSEEAVREEHRSWLLDQEIQRGREYQSLMFKLCDDLVADRCLLHEAATQLANSPRAKALYLKPMVRRYYRSWNELECLAIHLSQHALLSLIDDPSSRRDLAERLKQQFREAFAKDPPFDFDRVGANGRSAIRWDQSDSSYQETGDIFQTRPSGASTAVAKK
jgi:hypothetical protein